MVVPEEPRLSDIQTKILYYASRGETSDEGAVRPFSPDARTRRALPEGFDSNTICIAGGKPLVADTTPRRAFMEYQEAVDGLTKSGLLKPHAAADDHYWLTLNGFRRADALRSPEDC